jgi:hypothetical protein
MALTGFQQGTQRIKRVAGLSLIGAISVGAVVLPFSTSAMAAKKSSSSKKIGSLSSAVKKAEKRTFKATYEITSSAGNQSITIEQSPPKSVFTTSQVSIIDNGTTTYLCTPAGGTTTCITQSGGTNPAAALEALVNPSAVIQAFKADETYVNDHIAGYKVKFSSQKFAGLASTCVTATSKGATGKYCVTNSGILAYAAGSAGAGSGSVKLTSYSSTVSASDFSPPAGASTVTVPAGE